MKKVSLCLASLLSILIMAQPAQANGPRALKGTLTVIGTGAGHPDDLAVDAQDAIYFSDLAVTAVMRLDANGQAEVVSPPIQEPEGIVLMPDGTLIVVQQLNNQLFQVDPRVKSLALFYNVGNTTHNDGIDGISRDEQTGDILIPDAPTGRILRLSADGTKLTLVATGFVRPTSVVERKDGTLFVCDEYGNRLYQLNPDGTRIALAKLTLPDDVLLRPDGRLIVNSLNGTIWQIDPATRRAETVVDGLQAPHGIAMTSKGAIIIADFNLNRLYRLDLPSSGYLL